MRHRFRVAPEVDGVHAVCRRTAAVTRRHIHGGVDQNRSGRLRAGRQQLHRRRHVVAGLRIQCVQETAARDGVDVGVSTAAAATAAWRRRRPAASRGRGRLAERRRAGDRRHRAGAGDGPGSGRHRVQMPFPEHLVQVVVDRIDVVRAPADERQRLEALVGNDVGEQHRLRQRLQLPGLILELRLPEQLKARLPHTVDRNSRIGLDPRGSLRVAAGRGPTETASSLSVRGARSRECESDRQGDWTAGASHHHNSSLAFTSVRVPSRWPAPRAAPSPRIPRRLAAGRRASAASGSRVPRRAPRSS